MLLAMLIANPDYYLHPKLGPKCAAAADPLTAFYPAAFRRRNEEPAQSWTRVEEVYFFKILANYRGEGHVIDGSTCCSMGLFDLRIG